MKAWIALAFCLSLLLPGAPARAEDLFLVRSDLPSPEAMAQLQDAIVERGYTISRLQDVSASLTKRHYKSDSYRVVFFGKVDEIRQLSAAHPELIPYLPLSITIFAEGEQSILIASHPRFLGTLFPDPALQPMFARWENDLSSILDAVRAAD
ncbi:DUF302 domain-containing protein [Thermithiobacillus tepidarius DSM 3134]|uniref:DUF302 domain-containing protein n=1 Tax=Thermithiobacillus tepidarius TaxID=929 RepID=UPI0004044B52|nr:DUF302 domain-containing protein [Thermithiobacillus tepidarius]